MHCSCFQIHALWLQCIDHWWLCFHCSCFLCVLHIVWMLFLKSFWLNTGVGPLYVITTSRKERHVYFSLQWTVVSGRGTSRQPEFLLPFQDPCLPLSGTSLRSSQLHRVAGRVLFLWHRGHFLLVFLGICDPHLAVSRCLRGASEQKVELSALPLSPRASHM